MKSAEFYDEDYFERGIKSGKSTVISGYAWRPDLSFPLAMGIIDLTDLHPCQSVLDYGCAKGFLVKALRWLHRDAYGCDWSEYAINNVPDDMQEYVRLNDGVKIPWEMHFRLTITKDVLEHQDEEPLEELLSNIRQKSDQILVIVPLGDGQRHIIPEHDFEVSHMQRQPMEWWIKKLEETGFRPVRTVYRWPGIKPQWREYPTGSGIIHAT